MKYNILLLLLSVALTNLSGCASTFDAITAPASDKSHFYALSSLPPSNASNKNLRIGVGPLEIPRLLNRPQIVSRKDSAEVIMSEQHQWGGSYKEPPKRHRRISRILNKGQLYVWPI